MAKKKVAQVKQRVLTPKEQDRKLEERDHDDMLKADARSKIGLLDSLGPQVPYGLNTMPYAFKEMTLGDHLKMKNVVWRSHVGQREACWSERELQRFWNFLVDRSVWHKDGLGVVTVQLADGFKGYPPFILVFIPVDGKHRRTMIHIAMVAALDAARKRFGGDPETGDLEDVVLESTRNGSGSNKIDHGSPGHCKLEVSLEDAAAFRWIDDSALMPGPVMLARLGATPAQSDVVLNEGRIDRKSLPGNSSAVLLSAYDFFDNMFSDASLFPSAKRINTFWRRVLDNTLIHEKHLESHVDPQRDFENQNATSKPIGSETFAKTSVFGVWLTTNKCAAVGDRSHDFEGYWGGIKSVVGPEKMDDFLHTYAYARSGRSVLKDNYHLSIAVLAKRSAGAEQGFLDDLSECAKYFAALSGAKKAYARLPWGAYAQANARGKKAASQSVASSRFGRLMGTLGSLGVGAAALAMRLCLETRRAVEGDVRSGSTNAIDAVARMLSATESLLIRLAATNDMNHLTERIRSFDGPIAMLDASAAGTGSAGDLFVGGISNCMTADQRNFATVCQNLRGALRLDKKHMPVYKLALCAAQSVYSSSNAAVGTPLGAPLGVASPVVPSLGSAPAGGLLDASTNVVCGVTSDMWFKARPQASAMGDKNTYLDLALSPESGRLQIPEALGNLVIRRNGNSGGKAAGLDEKVARMAADGFDWINKEFIAIANASSVSSGLPGPCDTWGLAETTARCDRLVAGFDSLWGESCLALNASSQPSVAVLPSSVPVGSVAGAVDVLADSAVNAAIGDAAVPFLLNDPVFGNREFVSNVTSEETGGVNQ